MVENELAGDLELGEPKFVFAEGELGELVVPNERVELVVPMELGGFGEPNERRACCADGARRLW